MLHACKLSMAAACNSQRGASTAFSARAHAQPRRMLKHGKYKGCTWDHVLAHDKRHFLSGWAVPCQLCKRRPYGPRVKSHASCCLGYCGWLVVANREQRLPRNLRKFAENVEEKHGGVLMVGAHKDTFFDEVFNKHPDYAEWATSLVHPGHGMRPFAEYARNFYSSKSLY